MNDYPTALADACNQIVAAIHQRLPTRDAPILVALDGGSGAGKSTLALMLAKRTDAAVVQMDDFFAAGVPDWEWDTRSVEEKLRDVFDWGRLRREALEPLLAGEPAEWHPFDFEGGLRPDGTYGMSKELVRLGPAPIILLDGAYSAAPPLADLVDLSVLVDVPVAERHRRLAAREEADFLARWHHLWDGVEQYYFTHVRPPSSFDLVVSGMGRFSGGRPASP